MALLKDQNSKGVQFSKFIVFFSVLIAFIGLAGVIYLTVLGSLTEVVAVAIITILGGICSTSILFSLKKSQAENTVKLKAYVYQTISDTKINYLKEALEIKKKFNEPDDYDVDINVGDDFDDIENSALNDLSTSADAAFEEATSSIEYQEKL